MKVCLKKDLKIGNIQLYKHQEGIVRSVMRDADKHDGQFMYLVEFDKIGQLELLQSSVDTLRL